jgi:hypothetical protein
MIADIGNYGLSVAPVFRTGTVVISTRNGFKQPSHNILLELE